MKAISTFPLRLPRSIRAAVEKVSKQDGTSMNQFVATAVAEKLAVMDAEQFFKARQSRADLKKFDAIMKRKRGLPPRAGDEA
ncbi:Arc family DNA-binding protein [Hydrocarboniphaga sp.]|uniref:Arc family DNA-binding protein n=1 Tax=Hydrocarboniphaga sp. TaxID=2033016 RepID=UPI003D0C4EDA